MWMLPGAFWHFDVYQDIISSIRPAIFYDGVNCCSWNGGRNNISSNIFDATILEQYYTYSHRIAMTFSNAVIDISNDIGNSLLDVLSLKNNYVILRNEDLRKYIKSKYPNLQLVYSIVGTKSLYDKNFYTDILNKYDYIVPRFHHIYDIVRDFPTEVSRFEVMVNHTCPSNCPMWDKHYSIIEDDNRHRVYDTYDTKSINCLLNEAMTDDRLSQRDISKRVDKLLHLGVNRFKLAGREFPKERLQNEVKIIRKYL